MRITKALIALIVVCLSSGCFLLEQDELMVCEYTPLNGSLSYEVSYLSDDIHEIKIVHESDISMFDQDVKDQKLDDYEKEVDEHNKVDGLDAELIVDKDLVMVVIEVDTKVYDVDEDAHNIFAVDFNEDDFKTPKTLRDKLESHDFKCDPVVNE